MNYDYAYLMGCFLLFIPWMFIYKKVKNIHQEMLAIGLLLGFFAILTSRAFGTQYWTPQYILGPRLPLEDFLYGFFIGGVSSGSLHLFIKSKRHRKLTEHALVQGAAATMASAIAFFELVWVLGLNPIYSGLIVLLVLTLMMYFKRADLIVSSFISGLILLVVTFLGFSILLHIYPNLIVKWWHISNLSDIYINKIPIEELAWAFCLGLLVGPLYEFLCRDKIKLAFR